MRYTPVLLFLLLFFISFMPYLGSGPIFDQTLGNWLPSCYRFWWSSLLHVATFTNIDQLCLNWTWYLSADFQLFVLSPLLVYPAWRWRWKFFAAFPITIILSQVYIFVVSMVYNFMVFVGPLYYFEIRSKIVTELCFFQTTSRTVQLRSASLLPNLRSVRAVAGWNDTWLHHVRIPPQHSEIQSLRFPNNHIVVDWRAASDRFRLLSVPTV